MDSDGQKPKGQVYLEKLKKTLFKAKDAIFAVKNQASKKIVGNSVTVARLTLDSASDPPKPFPNKALTKSSQSDLVKIAGEHPELVKLIKSWPQLPEHIKQSIGTLVEICRTP